MFRSALLFKFLQVKYCTDSQGGKSKSRSEESMSDDTWSRFFALDFYTNKQTNNLTDIISTSFQIKQFLFRWYTNLDSRVMSYSLFVIMAGHTFTDRL